MLGSGLLRARYIGSAVMRVSTRYSHGKWCKPCSRWAALIRRVLLSSFASLDDATDRPRRSIYTGNREACHDLYAASRHKCTNVTLDFRPPRACRGCRTSRLSPVMRVGMAQSRSNGNHPAPLPVHIDEKLRPEPQSINLLV